MLDAIKAHTRDWGFEYKGWSTTTITPWHYIKHIGGRGFGKWLRPTSVFSSRKIER